MGESILYPLLGSLLWHLPVVAVSSVSLVALIRSKTIPRRTVKIAAAGFICLLLNAGIAIAFFALYLMQPQTETTTNLVYFRMIPANISFILTPLSLGFIARAIFSGRTGKA